MSPSLLPPFAALSNSARARNPFLLLADGCAVKSPNNSEPLSIAPLPLRSSASQASSAPALVQPKRSRVPLPFKSKSTPSLTPVSVMPSPLISSTTGEPPQVSQPRQEQVVKSYSPPNLIQRLAKVVLQLTVPPVAQQRPEPLGEVPVGQRPPRLTMQLPPADDRLQLKCSALTSRHRLPPVTLAVVEPSSKLNDTLALPPQLVPTRHDEKATPVAEAQKMVEPKPPVRFSDFKSLLAT